MNERRRGRSRRKQEQRDTGTGKSAAMSQTPKMPPKNRLKSRKKRSGAGMRTNPDAQRDRCGRGGSGAGMCSNDNREAQRVGRTNSAAKPQTVRWLTTVAVLVILIAAGAAFAPQMLHGGGLAGYGSMNRNGNTAVGSIEEKGTEGADTNDSFGSENDLNHQNGFNFSDTVGEDDADGDGGLPSGKTEAGGAGENGTSAGSGQHTGAPDIIIQQSEPEAETPVKLLFAGDVYLSDHVLEAYQNAGGIDGVLSQGYQAEISGADWFTVNEEFPFSTRGTPAEDKQFTFRLAPERVRMFREMKIDLVTLANNHALDYGTDALLDTIDTLDAAGIAHIGAGKNIAAAEAPVIREINGMKIGWIGASRVVPLSSWAAGKNQPGMLLAYEPERLLEQIKAVRQKTDYLVVYLHWGVERAEQPNDVQKSLGRACIDAGADLVIGAHPHVLQGIEYYKGNPIVYSLGNFVFGSSIPRTMLLEVTLSGDGNDSGAEAKAGKAALNTDIAALKTGTANADKTALKTSDGKMNAMALNLNTASARMENAITGAVSAGANSTITPVLRLIPGKSSAGHTRMLSDETQLQEFYRYMETISDGAVEIQDGIVKPAGAQ